MYHSSHFLIIFCLSSLWDIVNWPACCTKIVWKKLMDSDCGYVFSVSHHVKISFKTPRDFFLVLVIILIPYKVTDILLHHIHKPHISWLEQRCCWECLSILSWYRCQKYKGSKLSLMQTWFPPTYDFCLLIRSSYNSW